MATRPRIRRQQAHGGRRQGTWIPAHAPQGIQPGTGVPGLDPGRGRAGGGAIAGRHADLIDPTHRQADRDTRGRSCAESRRLGSGQENARHGADFFPGCRSGREPRGHHHEPHRGGPTARQGDDGLVRGRVRLTTRHHLELQGRVRRQRRTDQGHQDGQQVHPARHGNSPSLNPAWATHESSPL